MLHMLEWFFQPVQGQFPHGLDVPDAVTHLLCPSAVPSLLSDECPIYAVRPSVPSMLSGWVSAGDHDCLSAVKYPRETNFTRKYCFSGRLLNSNKMYVRWSKMHHPLPTKIKHKQHRKTWTEATPIRNYDRPTESPTHRWGWSEELLAHLKNWTTLSNFPVTISALL